jgi:hypothetical protein
MRFAPDERKPSKQSVVGSVEHSDRMTAAYA